MIKDMNNLTNYSESELKIQFANLTKDSVIELLKKFEIPYRKYESRKKLIEHAANNISSLGVYIRIGKGE